MVLASGQEPISRGASTLARLTRHISRRRRRSRWSEVGEDLALQLHPWRNTPNLTIHPDPMRHNHQQLLAGFPATIRAGASKTSYPKALQVGKGNGAEISTRLG
jgi:hypothetical protein